MKLRRIIGKSVLCRDNTVEFVPAGLEAPGLVDNGGRFLEYTAVPVPVSLRGLPYLELLECGHQVSPKRDRTGAIIEPSTGRRCGHCLAHEVPHVDINALVVPA